MQYSNHNIFSKIRDSENHFIINLISKNADILSPQVAEELSGIKENGMHDTMHLSEFIEKGYVADEKAESIKYKNAYLDFIDSRDSDEVQLFFVPNYSCNFACTYCYQDAYTNANSEVTTEIVDAFFNYIRQYFANRKKYITVFGSEPLLNSPKQKEMITYFISKANEHGLELSFVTNGYTLKDYVDIIKSGNTREVQITLDGTETVHNSRRFLKNHEGTFNRIVEGIDACLQNNITVNLRVVVDKENIEDLPLLSQFAIDKGWTKHENFKTQIGRNYELHHCSSSPEKLFSRISLYEKLYALIQEYPHIIEFYQPSYSISKFLFENGELPDPLFDACPACKTEWAFDYTGRVYSCTATVGKEDEALGTFFPEVTLQDDIVEQWQSRDVTEISGCSECSLQLACGGGCGSIAKNRTGAICSTDCRPVKELLELGFSTYADKI